MDLYQLLLFVICAGVIIAIAFLSKKLGYILPLVLCIFSLLFSVFLFFTQPKPSNIFEEPVANALHQMGLYLGLLFSLSFFLITFFTFRKKKKVQ
jgi:fructose-specific phosphotransferase system IIC component